MQALLWHPRVLVLCWVTEKLLCSLLDISMSLRNWYVSLNVLLHLWWSGMSLGQGKWFYCNSGKLYMPSILWNLLTCLFLTSPSWPIPSVVDYTPIVGAFCLAHPTGSKPHDNTLVPSLTWSPLATSRSSLPSAQPHPPSSPLANRTSMVPDVMMYGVLFGKGTWYKGKHLLGTATACQGSIQKACCGGAAGDPSSKLIHWF